MKNLPRVAICIPAYNEQYNLDHLLKQILAQKQNNFVIDRIIVASDGSSDKTVHIAKQYINQGVEIIDGKENRGQTYRQNEIISKVTSDILVLLNADLFIKSKDVIAHLIKPIINGADLTAQWARPTRPKTFLEKILVTGFILKYAIYSKYNDGDNIYTCVGHIRALSRKFYQSVIFPQVSQGEDQYLYLTCISRGYRYKNVNQDTVYFKLPQTFNDYIKYAKRIFQTQVKFEDVFDETLVKNERTIPVKIIINGILSSFMKSPFSTISYVLLHIFVQQWALRQPQATTHHFEIVTSTKILANIE